MTLLGSSRHKPKFMRVRKSVHLRAGKLSVETFGCLDKVGPLWIPNGLHIGWNHRILHLFWGSRGCSVTDLRDGFVKIPDPPRRVV
jgi:hypothetical protein